MAQYADIVGITVPSEAMEGSRVDITVRIKNLYSGTSGIMVGGALEYGDSPWPGITFPENSANVGPGSTHSFSGHFTMPNKKVTIHAYSYYYASDSYWHFDDELTKTVNLDQIPESDFGSIEIVSYQRR